MIISKLAGGLGNQMFQYARGRAVTSELKTDLKLDISGFGVSNSFIYSQDTPRQYSLDVFNIKICFADKVEVEKLIPKSTLLKKVLRRLGLSGFLKGQAFERPGGFENNLKPVKNDSYLEGWWQDERYFKKIENIIRSEFTLKLAIGSKAQDYFNEIKRYNAVGVHVRRGDYISNKNASAYHGVCSLEYYQAAIKIVSEKIEAPIFFIFSDDLEWCRNNLNINYPTVFVSDNKDYEDLILLSACRHNIIANSSFSWWAAWLNNNPEKIIIAPQRWFNDEKINPGIIPTEWIKI